MRPFGCVLVCCLVLAVGAGSGCKKAPPPAEPQAKAEPEKKAPEPPREEKKVAEKKPDLKAPQKYKGLVYNVRMAAQRPEIQNDLKQIGTFYQIEASGGSPPTTVAQMLAAMKGAGKLLSKINDEKVYVINLKGRKLQPTEILAYEREASHPEFFSVVRASGEVDPNVTFEQLSKELGIK